MALSAHEKTTLFWLNKKGIMLESNGKALLTYCLECCKGLKSRSYVHCLLQIQIILIQRKVGGGHPKSSVWMASTQTLACVQNCLLKSKQTFPRQIIQK
uniref:Uncharacterized protein n=1 Tax=Anguilla anguilla TaxID=7936 RepID=A0A0E9X6W1_ANGAN